MLRSPVHVISPHSVLLTPSNQITDMARRIEEAGRTCYKSEDKITPVSADKFVKGIVSSGHYSVIEHCIITVRIIGSRAMSHQLVRHRIAAFSQESQRYCNYNKLGWQVICPPRIAATALKYATWLDGITNALSTYQELVDSGVKPEDARYNLPNAMKTEIVTTFNLRQWKHVFCERAINFHAQWEIRAIMQGILCTLYALAPVFFKEQFELYLLMEKEHKIAICCHESDSIA